MILFQLKAKKIYCYKIKKIEEEEKLRKLIEEILSFKSFKLYILNKYGNGKYDIFIQTYENGEINRNELIKYIKRIVIK